MIAADVTVSNTACVCVCTN